MFKFILLVIYIFLPISVIFIEQKNPSEAVAWVIVLLLLPFVGAFIYMIFGSTLTIKITYNVRTKLLKKRYLNSVNSNNLVSGNLQDCKFSNEQNQVAKFNKNYNNSVLTFYDEKEIFTTGKEHYESLFNDLENAKESIHIQYYTVHNDSIGKRFIEILAKKAREGVEVLLMCDYLANITTPRKFFKPLIKANGHVKKN
ncbi:MAG: PLDc N-terminal domain-containing protein [Clostridiales bacterium]|nr:PLDc N-terminal domain-containing protein [Clostridiales bacterium]